MAVGRFALGACIAVMSFAAFAGNTSYEAAQKAGVRKCLPAVKKITDFIIENGTHGSFDRWSTANPDRQQFTTTIERNFQDGVTLSNVVVSPVATGECAVAYDQIGFFEKSCLAVKSELFSKFEYKGEVGKEVAMIAGQNGNIVVFLMSVKGGCISVKKETFADANGP